MANTGQVSLRLPKDLLKLLGKIAKRDVRDRTNLIEFILINWLREHEPEEFGEDGTIIDKEVFLAAKKEAVKGRKSKK